MMTAKLNKTMLKRKGKEGHGLMIPVSTVDREWLCVQGYSRPPPFLPGSKSTNNPLTILLLPLDVDITSIPTKLFL